MKAWCCPTLTPLLLVCIQVLPLNKGDELVYIWLAEHSRISNLMRSYLMHDGNRTYSWTKFGPKLKQTLYIAGCLALEHFWLKPSNKKIEVDTFRGSPVSFFRGTCSTKGSSNREASKPNPLNSTISLLYCTYLSYEDRNCLLMF